MTEPIDCTTVDPQAVIQQFGQFVMGNYARTPIVVTRAHGPRLWDANGRCYLDFFPGWGVGSLGYCHPAVVEAIRHQAGDMIHIDNSMYTPQQGQLAQLLVEKLGYPAKAFFCNSGAEANEAAIKIARRFHATQFEHAAKQGQPPYKIITTTKGFHGRTYAAMTATAQSKIHHGFAPLVPGFVYVHRDDLDALARAIDPQTAAILLEPVQGEGGVNVPADDYLPTIRNLCDQHGLLLICDEVQCGSGRVGCWFSHDLWNVKPDIVCLAKGLASGPSIGAVLVREHLADCMTPGSHGSTFGGNPLACAAALATLKTIEDEGLLQHANQMGNYLRESLTRLKDRFNVIDHVRGAGMMIGVQFTTSVVDLARTCLELGLRVNCTQETVIRMLPPLNLSQADADEGLALFEQALQNQFGSTAA